MTRRRRLILMVVAVVSLAGIAFWLLRPREPEYQGRPLSAWLEELSRARSEAEAQRAADAIHSIGEPAIPHLISLVRHRDSPLRIWVRRWRGFFNLDPKFPSSTEELQERGYYGFMALGPTAKMAIPQLAALLEDENCADAALLSLIYIGTNAYPVLIHSLSNGTPSVRISSATYLRHLKEFRATSIPALQQLVASTNGIDPDLISAARASLSVLTNNYIP